MDNATKTLITQEVLELETIMDFIEEGNIQNAVDFAYFCIKDKKYQLWKSGIDDIDNYFIYLPVDIKAQLLKRWNNGQGN